MTKTEFDKIFNDDLIVNGPQYRGAPQPAFDPGKVNESRFADELRPKWWNFSFIECNDTIDDTVVVEWKSQEWSYDIDSLIDELTRCLKYHKFAGNVELTVYERGCKGSGECEDYREFEII